MIVADRSHLNPTKFSNTHLELVLLLGFRYLHNHRLDALVEERETILTFVSIA